jgi:hypothetical protein
MGGIMIVGMMVSALKGILLLRVSDAGQQTKELKPGKERSLEEEESQRREERRVGRCKICNFH